MLRAAVQLSLFLNVPVEMVLYNPKMNGCIQNGPVTDLCPSLITFLMACCGGSPKPMCAVVIAGSLGAETGAQGSGFLVWGSPQIL